MTITVKGDTKFELDETFSVNLSGAINASILDGAGLGTITNDDLQPAISIDDIAHSEGNLGTQVYTFTVSLSNPNAQTVSVDYATADGTATTSDQDYSAASNTIVFQPNQLAQTVAVTVKGDTKFELDETFSVNLSGAINASILDGAGLGTITNDDSQPAISIDDIAHSEGNLGTQVYTFTVSLSNPNAQTVSVDYATADGTATTSDQDYSAASNTIVFQPNQLAQTVAVTVKGDTKFELDETFSVNLSGAINASILDGAGLGTITNDDLQPAISIDDIAHSEGNLSNDQQWLAANRQRILRTRQRMSRRIAELGFQVVPSQANFVWCTHPARPARELAAHLEQNKVFVRYMNYDQWGDGLRISVGTDDQVDACLELLRSGLQ